MRYEDAFREPPNIDRESGPVQPFRPSLPPATELPVYNPFLRSPLPLMNAKPDSLRQFYRSGVPQWRILTA